MFKKLNALLRQAIIGFPLLMIPTRWIGRALGRGSIAGELIGFDQWVKVSQSSPEDLIAEQMYWSQRPDAPLVSVILPTFKPDSTLLAAAVLSVVKQTYLNWELILVDDGTPSPDTHLILEEIEDSDPRIRLVKLKTNQGISKASNEAVSQARGEICSFLDHDDALTPDALSKTVRAFMADPDCQLVFSDEDKFDVNGKLCEPYFKPGVNHALLYSRNYVNHLTSLRRSAFDRVGGLDEVLEGAQDYDLVLKVLEVFGPVSIAHIPHILYHWRKSEGKTSFSESRKLQAWKAGAAALTRHLTAGGAFYDGLDEGFGGGWRIRFKPLTPLDKISVIIPTRDGLVLLEKCVASVLQSSGKADLEIIVVDNDSIDEKMLSWLSAMSEKNPAFKVVRAPGEFNYSRLMNAGARHAKGDYLLLLNNDVFDGRENWLSEMLGYARMKWVGAVGAKLLYPDGRLQHGGIVLGAGGAAGHLERGIRGHKSGAFGHLSLPRCVSAVTAACLMVRADVFHQVNGFDEESFPVTFSDVDFCLRIREAGFENVWTPYSILTHAEGGTRGREKEAEKTAEFQNSETKLVQRWGHVIEEEPFHNPNLSLVDEQVRIKKVFNQK